MQDCATTMNSAHHSASAPTEATVDDHYHYHDETTSSPAITTSTNKTIWYLGGNHSVKLLTSVDGDFDPTMLSKLETVPSVVGELALSVESLVSDDVATIGGFESDILAKIATNTLNARRESMAKLTAASPPTSPTTGGGAASAVTSIAVVAPSSSSSVQDQDVNPALEGVSAETTTSPPTGTGGGLSVPNPLLEAYEPVPNPLARITPPGSPSTFASLEKDNKRKSSYQESTTDDLSIPDSNDDTIDQRPSKLMRKIDNPATTETR
jgi:hypothetical protein